MSQRFAGRNESGLQLVKRVGRKQGARNSIVSLSGGR